MAANADADAEADSQSRWPSATAYVRIDDDGVEYWHTDRDHREDRRYER
jgi:hypothetical protein